MRVTLYMLMLGILSVKVNAFPHSVYVDGKEKQQGAYLSDAEVGDFLRNKLEEQDIKPAIKAIEYLVELMGTNKPVCSNNPCQNGGTCSPNGDGSYTCNCTCNYTGDLCENVLVLEDNHQCVEAAENTNTDNSRSLTIAQLKTILNTISGKENDGKILITLDHGNNMFTDDGSNPPSAYRRIMDDFKTGQTTDMWANYAPCPSCAFILLKRTAKLAQKPTIHIGRIFTESSTVIDAVKTIVCLAKLEKNGFNVTTWNFTVFQQDVSTSCDCVINKRIQNSFFKAEYEKLQEHLSFIKQLSKLPNTIIDSLCMEN